MRDTFGSKRVAGHHEIFSITYAAPSGPIANHPALESPRRGPWPCVNTSGTFITKAAGLGPYGLVKDGHLATRSCEGEALGIHVSTELG